MTLPVSPVVAADRYPAPVTLPDGRRESRARVIVTCPEGDQPGRVLVFTAPRVPLFDAAWDPARSWAGTIRVDWQLATDQGVVVVAPGTGCRCGRLGHWSPFDGPERAESITKVIRRAREAGLGEAT